MYRRNQDRCRECVNDSPCDTASDLSFEEYELYRYNIPPRYDGNRFRRKSEIKESFSYSEKEPIVAEACEAIDEEAVSEKPQCCDVDFECLKKESGFSLGKLLDKMGSEELLIIALILTVAGGEDSGELLFILVLLLLNG